MVNALALLFQTPVLVAAIFISGIGGTFQYGFHISVMTSPSDFIKELVNRTCVQRYHLSLEEWQLSLIWSFLLSIFCVGGLLGSLCAGRLASRYGRKRCLLLNNLLAISGSILMLLSETAVSFEMIMVGRFVYGLNAAVSFEMIMVGRFVYGLNAGVSLSVHTMYLVECSPKRLRGMVGVTVATLISLGKFTGQLLGTSELLGTEQRWPWLLAFPGLTGLLQLLTLPLLPESPRFLLLDRGDPQACERAIRRLWGPRDHRVEVEEMETEHAAQQGVRSHSVRELLIDKSVRWQLLTTLVTFTTLQLCGVNAVYLYSYEIFRAAGIPSHQLRHVALGTGLCEISTSIACFLVIEMTGKKLLMVRGYIGMAATLGLLTVTLYLQKQVVWMPYCSMVLIFIFVFLFSSGPAGVTAPLPGEIFSQAFKAAGFTIACTVNWTGLFLVGMVFPLLVEYLDYFCFLFFLCFCVLCGVFVYFNVPETRNQTVLEITAEFHRMHPQTHQSQRRKPPTTANHIHTRQTKL